MDTEKKQIYVIISQTGTILSRIIKRLTGAQYNHASISLDKELTRMYSFGRANPYNAFIGTFVRESPNFGTFKRFKETDAVIIALDVDEDTYSKAENLVETMWQNRKKYHYNYLGLYLAAVHIFRQKKNCFYCSEFVAYVLRECNVPGNETLGTIIHPMDFFKFPHRKIYTGKLRDYEDAKIKETISN